MRSAANMQAGDATETVNRKRPLHGGQFATVTGRNWAGKRRMLVPIAVIRHEAPGTVGEGRVADPNLPLANDGLQAGGRRTGLR